MQHYAVASKRGGRGKVKAGSLNFEKGNKIVKTGEISSMGSRGRGGEELGKGGQLEQQKNRVHILSWVVSYITVLKRR